jgi:sporulation protein YlmC with PRC-barrel domain
MAGKKCTSKNICLEFFTVLTLLIFTSLPASSAGTPAAKTAGPRPAGQGMTHLEQGFRASKIIDGFVKNSQGQELGEVDDLIMARSGKIKRVVISVGWFLGMGERLVAVPFRSLRINEKGNIIYDVTKERLEKHPPFNYRQEGLYRYYYAPPPPYGSLGPVSPLRYPGYPMYGRPHAHFPPLGKFKEEYLPWEWEYFPERLRVSAVLGRTALNDKGENLGEVDDLIIDRDGKVVQIILSVGGLADIPRKLVALPFKQLLITDLGIVYDVSRERLKELPAFRYDKQ